MTPRVMLDAYVVLQDGAMDAWGLAAEVHCHYRTAARVLAEMHALGLVHIREWQRRQGAHLAVYAYGAGVDAPKLVPLTDRERKAQGKIGMTVEERDFANARRRQLRRKIKIDPLSAAFFRGR